MKLMKKVYAARAYTPEKPRTTKFVEINDPHHLPTIPKDDKKTETILSSDYFINENFPVTQKVVTNMHYLSLPLLEGTPCPAIFPKGTIFLLICPTEKLEEGFLLYISDTEVDG